MFKRCFCVSIFLLILIQGIAFAKKFKTGILFNTEAITVDNVMNSSKTFKKGERVYYLFISDKQIKAQFIRVQIIKASDKVPRNAFSIVYANDFMINRDSLNYYHDYFVIHSSGHYFMQIFDKNNLIKPLARNDFVIK